MSGAAFSHDRWTAAWEALGAKPADDLREKILDHYRQSSRHYHNVQHLGECLSLAQEFATAAKRPHEIEIALWFHDVIYDSQAKDNELKSAEWAKAEVQQAGASTDAAERVFQLIMATCHDAIPDEPDAKLLVDIDLAILGAQPERFDDYEVAVRREYEWVPEDDFRHARASILKAFLDREVIYSTTPLRQRFERQARRNLGQALSQLGA